MLTIKTRQLGRRRPLLEDWSIVFPPEWADDDDPMTLRELITRVVLAEVQAFRRRQKERRLIKVLTASQIQEGAERGKVQHGGSDLDQEVDEPQAVGAALQAFEDGLYLVIIDELEYKSLDQPVYLNEESTITFLRLTMLAGG